MTYLEIYNEELGDLLLDSGGHALLSPSKAPRPGKVDPPPPLLADPPWLPREECDKEVSPRRPPPVGLPVSPSACLCWARRLRPLSEHCFFGGKPTPNPFSSPNQPSSPRCDTLTSHSLPRGAPRPPPPRWQPPS